MNKNWQVGGEDRRPGGLWGHVGINSDRWQLLSYAKDTHEWTHFCQRGTSERGQGGVHGFSLGAE